MTDAIVTPALTLTAETQLALANDANGLLNLLANPATDMGIVLAGAELLLARYATNIEPFVLSGSQTLVGKAGVILGMGQLASAIGDLKAGKSFGQVYGDLATSLSGMVGSTGLMMEAYAGMLTADGSAAAAASVLKFALPMNQLGFAFTVGTVVGTGISKNLPDEVNMAIGGTLHEMGSMIQASIDGLIGSSATSASPLTTTTINGDWATKDFGNGITQRVLINPSGTGFITDPNVLVLDRNGNGTIDNGTELFGDSTQLAAGVNAADGFAALAGQDTNLDGAVNALDANFASLKVWQDLNQDGISQAGELKSLSALGIASLNIAKTTNIQTVTGGNQIADLGNFTRTDGTTSVMADVNLASDTFHRSFTEVIPANALHSAANDAVSGVRRAAA